MHPLIRACLLPARLLPAVARAGGAAGSFTNNFTGITNIVTTGTTTNVLDNGAATNPLKDKGCNGGADVKTDVFVK